MTGPDSFTPKYDTNYYNSTINIKGLQVGERYMNIFKCANAYWL